MTKKQRPSAKQRKLIAQLPAIVSGKKTAKKALLDAGYSKNVADKQAAAVLGSAGVRTPMQEALQKAGVTVEKIAEKINAGLDAKRKFAVHDGEDVTYEFDDDYATRHKYVVTAAELHDVFPTKKVEITTPMTYGDLEGQRKAKSVDEARRMAEDTGEE